MVIIQSTEVQTVYSPLITHILKTHDVRVNTHATLFHGFHDSDEIAICILDPEAALTRRNLSGFEIECDVQIDAMLSNFVN